MIITDKQISLSANAQRSESIEEHERLALYRLGAEGEVEQVSEQVAQGSLLREQAVSQVTKVGSETHLSVSSSDPVHADQPLEPRYQLMAAIVGAMTGKEVRIFNAASLEAESQVTSAEISIKVGGGDSRVDGMRYDWSRETTLTESVNFDAQASLKTADGRSLSITLALDISVTHTERESLVLRAGIQMKDPLVINFSGSAAQLADQMRNFDIDADGQLDQVYQLDAKSGFLALDKNSDGQINDGSELFGALSGDGFKELKRFDQDGNGFIDEGDEVFGRLQIWVQDSQSGDQLVSLADKGIGAIYLGSVATPMTLYAQGDQLGGQLRSTGFFVREDGSSSTVQQIDLKA